MATYPFRNALAQSGLEPDAVTLAHYFLDRDHHWSNRDTVIDRLNWLPQTVIMNGAIIKEYGPLHCDEAPNAALHDAYIRFHCNLCLANQALRYFGYEIIQGEMENYRLAAIRQEAA